MAAEREGGIPQAIDAAFQKQAIKGAMQCLSWLMYSKIPHTTKYSNLVDTVQFMDCEHKSECIIQEFLEVISNQIKQKQLNQVSSSLFFSIIINKSTNVVILNEMVVYARYINDRDVKNTFLRISELFNGKVETIESYLLACLEENDHLLSKLVGLGTDGVSVMTSRHNGVVDCLCHCLALAVAQAGNEVPFIA